MLKKSIMSAVLVCLLSGSSIVNSVEAQTAVLTKPTPANTTTRQRAYLKASVQERIKFAEALGESGARKFASAKNWKPLFDGVGRTIAQGPDQVYRGADGMIHVIEAKGGTSPLSRAFGHAQGTPEWAVQSAKNVLHSKKAAVAEKSAAREVLKAASQGKLKVHVIRTKHILGEPTVALLEKTMNSTDEAAALAREAIGHSVKPTHGATSKAAKELTDDAVRSVDDVARTGAKTGSKVLRGVAKGAVVVGAAVDVGFRANDAVDVEKKYQAGAITNQQREVAHVKNAAGMAGGWGGAFGGAKVGALGGGAVGTACGGVGAPIGAVAGGVAGGVAGYIGGEAAAEVAAEWTIKKVHQTGNTIAGAASSAKDGVVNAWNYVWGK